jgi:hypothetical protein
LKLYHIMLFVHICALLVAIAASTLSHFAAIRMQATRTVGELRGWTLLVNKVGRAFPIALLVLVASGAYMVNKAWTWKAGWVNAALVGVVVLFACGGYVGSRVNALRRALTGDADAAVDPAIARMLRDPLTNSIAWANTFLAIGIVYIMVNKSGLVDSILALAVAMAIGVVVAIPSWRTGTGAAVGAVGRERS